MKATPLSALSVVVLSLAACQPSGGGGGGEETSKVEFVNDVKPILQTQCVRCHNDQSLLGGLNLMNRELAMRGSKRGPVLIPGDAEKSPLYRVTLLPAEQDHAMPATGAKLTDAEKEIIRQWIDQGADWPEGAPGTMEPVSIEPKKA